MRRAVTLATTLTACLALPQASALTLTGPGTPTTLTGTLGTVDVVAISDDPTLDGAVTSGGLVASGLGISVTRVQYDLLNRAGNSSIFEFRVDYQPGTTVVAAGNPGAFRQADGTLQTYWAGSNFATLFDTGFGLYTADRDDFGSEWIIDYQPDHIRWEHLGNGFFPDTAVGATDLGNAGPSFMIHFKRGTPIGLQAAEAEGISTLATGRTLSAIPEPQALALALGSVSLLVGTRRLGRRIPHAPA